MPWAAAVTAAGAIGSAAISSSKGGSSLTSGSNNTSTSSSQVPWTPQGNALASGFGEASNVYNMRSAEGPYTGALYGDTQPQQTQAVNNATDWSNYGSLAAKSMWNNGANLSNGATPGFLNNATNLASGNSGYGQANQGTLGSLQGYGTGQQTALSGGASNVSGALSDAATNGARALGSYNSGLSTAMNSALSDPTAQLSADAGAYMNSAPLQAQLQNVHNQINSTLTEETNPGLNRTAAMGGNLNSSRAGMAEAMANRSAALAEGNADASVLSNAWNTGLNTAAGQRTAGLNTATSAANSGLGQNGALAQGYLTQDTNSRLTADNQALGQDLGYQTLGANTQLTGNSQLGQAITTGSNMLTGSNALANSSNDELYKMGQAAQTDQTNKNTAAYQSWNLANQYQQNLLNDYFNNVGKQSYGYTNTGTGTTTSNSSLLGTALGSGALVKALTSSDGTTGGNSAGGLSGWLDRQFNSTSGQGFDSGGGTLDANGNFVMSAPGTSGAFNGGGGTLTYTPGQDGSDPSNPNMSYATPATVSYSRAFDASGFGNG